MKIKIDEVRNVSISVGLGYSNNKGVRSWMESKGFLSYLDYAQAYCKIPQQKIQDEIEQFVFGGA